MLAVTVFVKTNTSGPGWSYTNAPVTSSTRESNCTSCHNSFSLVTSGTNHNRINLTTNFTGSGYIPDSTYSLVLGYKETGKSKFGFQMTCLEESSYKPAGTFTNGDSRSQTGTASVNFNTRYYIGHTSTGTGTVTTDSTNWKITWKAPSRNVGKVVFWVVLNVTDAGSGSGNDYIYSKSFTFSPSNLLPTAKAKILDANICSNTQLSFAADVTGSPSNYSWTFPSGSPSSSTSATPKVTYTGSGTFKATVTVRNSKGSSVTDTLTFVVKAGPGLPVISPAGTQNICKGDSLRLSTTPTSNVTYKWSPNNETKQFIYAKDSGTYSVTVTSANGCSRTATAPVKVVVNPVPVISLAHDFSGDTICALTEYVSTIKRTSGPADSFSYISKTGPFTTDSTKKWMHTSGPATIQGWAKSTKGCVGAASMTVQVNQPKAGPLAGISAPQLSSFRVTWSAVSGAKSYLVSMDSGKTFITPSSGGSGLYHDVTGLTAGEKKRIYLKALVSGICTETAVSNIEGAADTCRSLPFTLSASDNVVCKNAQTQLIIKGLKGKNIGVKINGNYAGRDTSYMVNVPGYTVFSVSVIDSGAVQCGYTTRSIPVYEDTIDQPATSLTGIASQLICSKNASATLNVTATKKSTQDTILWFKNNLRDGITPAHTFTVSDKDSVWAVAKNTRGCTSKGNVTRINMPGLPDAGFTQSNTDYNYTFTAKDASGTHSWKGPGTLNGSGSSTVFDLQTFKGTTVRIYHTLTKNGCSATDSLDVPVANLGTGGQQPDDKINWYPNPAADVLFINTNGLSAIKVVITDATGKTVLEQQLGSGLQQINVSGLSAGIYQLSISGGGYSKRSSLSIRR